MKFDLAKLDHLKTLVCCLWAGQKRADKLSTECAEMECCPAWAKKHATLTREIVGNEKLAAKVAALVQDIGINDVDPDRTYHDGWSERK